MRTIEAETHGRWKPGANRIYPILSELEEAGWIISKADDKGSRKRKYIEMTKNGNQAATQLIGITQRVLDPWLELLISEEYTSENCLEEE